MAGDLQRCGAGIQNYAIAGVDQIGSRLADALFFLPVELHLFQAFPREPVVGDCRSPISLTI